MKSANKKLNYNDVSFLLELHINVYSIMRMKFMLTNEIIYRQLRRHIYNHVT